MTAVELEALPVVDGYVFRYDWDGRMIENNSGWMTMIEKFGIVCEDDDFASIGDSKNIPWATGKKDGRKVRIRVDNLIRAEA